MKLMSPEGTEIVGTYEKITGCAEIKPGTAKRLADGQIDFEWNGETEVYWDDQRTAMRQGPSGKLERVFLDEGGAEYLESELKLVEEDQ